MALGGQKAQKTILNLHEKGYLTVKPFHEKGSQPMLTKVIEHMDTKINDLLKAALCLASADEVAGLPAPCPLRAVWPRGQVVVMEVAGAKSLCSREPRL